jgi:hypothetical protein
MEKKELINPPGTLLKKIVVNGNMKNELLDYVTANHIGEITFGITFSQPLPTLNQAVRTDESLKITAVFLVDTILMSLKVKINQLFVVGNYGEKQLQFFIYCDIDQLTLIKENLTTDNTYRAFKVEFTTDLTTGFPQGPSVDELTEAQKELYTSSKIEMKDIEVVQTFLWDIDPKTSRGTVTTVQTTS